MYLGNCFKLEPLVHRGLSALLSLAFSAALVVTPNLTNIGDHCLYGSAWAKDGGRSGGNGGGNGGGGRGGGNSGGGNAGNSSGKSTSFSVTGSAKSKSTA